MPTDKMKPLLLFLALIGAIFWNSPNSVSMFSETHSYSNITDIDCVKCHSDILAQLSDVGRVNNIHLNINSSDPNGCKKCHMISNTLNISEDYHAAFSPNCIDCHPNILTNITGKKESHSTLVTDAENSSIFEGVNEACVTCHSKTALSITIGNRVIFAFENDSILANGTVEFNGTYFIC